MSAQSMEALRRANEVRFQRAADKRAVAAMNRTQGVRALAEIIRGPDRAYFSRTTIFSMLQWPNNVGPIRAQKILVHAGASASRPVGQLTQRQRDQIAMELQDYAYLSDRMAA